MAGRNIKAGEAFVAMRLRSKAFVAGLNRASQKLKDFGRSVSAVGKKLVGFSAAAAIPIAFATKTFADFADQMSTVRAVTGATAKQFTELNDKAKELGRTTSFTASEVAGAMTELGRAGFRPEEIDASIADILSLARATGTDLPLAAQIAGGAMRAFGLESADMGMISDTLTATANNSAQTLEDLGESMKFAAPLARQAGVSITDTSAALGVLANNGIRGSMAGTALARSFKNLSTSSTAKVLKEIGVETADADGNLRNVATIIAEIGQALEGAGSAKKLATFTQVFGRASASAAILANAADFKGMQSSLTDVNGIALKTANIMDDNLGGSFRILMSAIEGVQIAIGEALAPTLRDLATKMTDVAGSVTKWIMENKGLVVAGLKVLGIVGVLGAALVVLGTSFALIGSAIGGIVATFTAITGAIGGVITAVSTLGAVLGALISPLGIIIALVVGIAIAFVDWGSIMDRVGAFIGKSFDFIKGTALKTFEGIRDALAVGDISAAAGILMAGLNVVFQKGLQLITTAWSTWKTNILDILDGWRTGAMAIVVDFSAWMAKNFPSVFIFLSDIVADMIAKIKTAFFVAKALGAALVALATDTTLDEVFAELKEDLKEVGKELVETKKATRAITQLPPGEIDEIGEQIKQTVVVEEKARSDARKRELAKTISDAEKAFKDSQDRLDKLVGNAAKKRAMEGIADAPEPPKIPELSVPDFKPLDINIDPEKVKKDLDEATEGIKTDVLGAFSGRALAGLGFGSAAERTAKATEATVKEISGLREDVSFNDTGIRFT